MGRAILQVRHGRVTTGRRRLPEITEKIGAKLTSLVGFMGDEDAREMLGRVHDVLELWPGLEQDLDFPTRGEVLVALEPFADRVSGLQEFLDTFDTHSLAILAANGIHPERLGALWRDASRAVQTAKTAWPWKNARKDHSPHAPLRFIVQQLVRVFAYYVGLFLDDGTKTVHTLPPSEAFPEGKEIAVFLPSDIYASESPEDRLAFVLEALRLGKVEVGTFDVEGYLAKLDKAQGDYLNSLDG